MAAAPERRRGEGPIEAPAERWSFELGAVVYARPTLVEQLDGRVIAYVGSHAGRFVGVVAEGAGAGRPVLDLWVDGIIWSTAVADARGWLYFGADDDHLYAVDPEAGSIAWSRRLGECDPPRAPGPEGVRCDVDGGPSLAPGGDLFVGADGLYRVADDGTIRWHYPPKEEGPGAHVATTPLVTDELVVFGNYARKVIALDHDGALRWELPLGADVDGSPVVGRDGTIYVGSDDGSLHALDPSGTLRWSYDVGAEVRGQAVVGPDGAIVFGSHDGNLYALEPSGELRWLMPTQGAIHAPVAIDGAGRIFVGSRDEHLYAIDLDGHVYWNLELPDQIDSGVAIAPGGTLVLGCDDGVLRGLR
ncbi:MAG: PQQ-binding-like beta-propeller repeat protein [Myxococcales bacterium]|nr:PQQ-binding-like beta-propeller repeat protein [Myxococcales bacterium]MCB9713215.1 PQQ-binding-like beta-propeller repeat protein [Myxococcales bacterium]